MTRFVSLLLSATLLCVFGTSCRIVQTNVTAYHILSSETGNYEYEFVDSKNKPKLEFERIKSLISTRLSEFGWSESHGEDSQYYVSVDYGIGGSHVVSGSVPIIGQTSGGTTYHSGSVYGNYGSANYSGTSYSAPTYGVVGSSSYSRKMNERFLLLNIQDEAGESVYECRAKSDGSASEINLVIDEMIDSIFKNFPGASGKTYKVTMPFVE